MRSNNPNRDQFERRLADARREIREGRRVAPTAPDPKDEERLRRAFEARMADTKRR